MYRNVIRSALNYVIPGLKSCERSSLKIIYPVIGKHLSTVVQSVIKARPKNNTLAAYPWALRAFSSESDIRKDIDELVKNSKVVVFMKGVPDAPRCGFSNAVCQIMQMHGVAFDSYDVLEDEKLRQGIKDYSKWPTIPQVFIKGQFVGGCDVMLQLHQSGELVEELEKVGIRSALLDKADPEK